MKIEALKLLFQFDRSKNPQELRMIGLNLKGVIQNMPNSELKTFRNALFTNYMRSIAVLTITLSAFCSTSVCASTVTAQPLEFAPQYQNYHLAGNFPTGEISDTPPASRRDLHGPENANPLSSEGRAGAVSAISNEEQEEARLNRRKRKTLVGLEIAYQLLGALDAAQTISCVSKPTCSEGNPILGKRPSVAAILAFKLAAGLLHYNAFRGFVKKEKYNSGMAFEIVSITLQGVVCGLNFRYAF